MQSGQVNNFIGGTAILAHKPDGTLILPFVADYMQWSPDAARAVQGAIQVAQSQRQRAEVHVLGKASPVFKDNSRRMGVSVIEFN